MAVQGIGILLRQVRRILGGPVQDASDGQLLERFARQHDEVAFTDLVRRYGPLVWDVSRRVTGQEQDAEDVFQATFLILARKAGSIRKGNSVGSWLYGVAYRLALRARHAAARRLRYETQAPSGPAAAPSDELTWRDLRRVLDEELACLPDKYRAPLLLCYFEGQTQDEAARRLGWTKRAVKDRLERGRRRMRSRLTRRGLTLSAALTGPLLLGASAPAAVPMSLTETTVRAAAQFAVRRLAAGAVSAKALTLAEGGLHAMFLGKLKLSAGLLAILMLGGAGLLAGWAALAPTPEAAPPGRDGEKAAVDRYGDPLPPGAVLRLGTVRYRHATLGLTFLADGKTVVAAQPWEGNGIQFWDPRTGKLVREIDLGKLTARQFAVSRDTKTLAVAGFLTDPMKPGWQSVIRVLETSSGKELRTFERERRDGDQDLALTPDGKFLMSVGRNGLFRIEEVATGLELLTHQFPGDYATVALSPDGTTVALASGPNTHKLFVWRWQAAEEPREIDVGRYWGRGLTFSPDGKRLAVGSDTEDGVCVYDVASRRLLHKLELPDYERFGHSYLAFSPDGKTLAAAGRFNNRSAMHLWDVVTGRFLKALDIGDGPPAFSPDGKLLVAGQNVWDFEAGKELSANDQAHRGEVERVLAAGKDVVVTTASDNTVRLWDAATGKQRLRLAHGGWVRAVALSPDGTELASSSLDDTVCLWDVATGRKIYRLPGHGRYGGYRALAFTPDGKSFFSWGDDMYLRKYDVATGKALLEHAIRPTGVRLYLDPDEEHERDMKFNFGHGAFDHDSKQLVLVIDRKVFVFDTATGKELRNFPAEGIDVIYDALSPDGKLLLVNSWDRPVEVKNKDGSVTHSILGHSLVLLDLATGKERKRLRLPGSNAGPVAFSADGRLFAAASSRGDASIHVYDTETGQEVRVIQGPRGGIRSLAFTPDGRRLVTGMDDSTALIWTVDEDR